MEIKQFIGELWRPVKGYEGWYEVSSFGRVRSVDRVILRRNNSVMHLKGKIKEETDDGHGYWQVMLYKNGIGKGIKVHRLVAEAFIEIPEHLKHLPLDKIDINHKNENKKDNMVENLEWCTRQYNINYGTAKERRCKKVSHPVVQYTMKGEYVNEYPSIHEANRQTKINTTHILQVCRGERKSAGIKRGPKYIWRYKNKRDTE